MGEARRKRIYLCVPDEGNRASMSAARRSELSRRLRCKGYDPVCAVIQSSDGGDVGNAPSGFNKVACGINLLLQCDGILIDIDAKRDYACACEMAVANVMAARKNKFVIFHTKEQWDDVNKRYTI